MTNDTNIESDIEIDADTAAGDTEIPMRILRIATCPSLSGRSELTYHVGCDEAGAIWFRLYGNTGAGLYGNMRTSMADVSRALSSLESFSSSALAGIFDQTSRNNPGFLMAVLQGENLIEKSASKPGAYTTANPAPFLARINALAASGVDLDPNDKPSDAPAIAATAAPKRGRPKKQSA